MAEAVRVQCGESVDWTADAAYSAGDVIQLRDGRAGVVSNDVASGGVVGVWVSGIFKFLKTTSMVLLNGGRAYWDHSANKVHFARVSDRDFFQVGKPYTASLALARNGSPRGYVFTIKTPDDKFIYLTFGSVGSDPLNKDGKGGLGNGHPTSFQN